MYIILLLLHFFDTIVNFFEQFSKQFKHWFFDNNITYFAVVNQDNDTIVVRDYENKHILLVILWYYWKDKTNINKEVYISNPSIKYIIMTYYVQGQQTNRIIGTEVDNNLSDIYDVNYVVCNNINVTRPFKDFRNCLSNHKITLQEFAKIIEKRYMLNLHPPFTLEIMNKDFKSLVFKDNDIIMSTYGN